MKIELEVERDSPLCIADAIIEYETRYVNDDCMRVMAKECIRQIGKALCECADSADRVREWLEKE